MYGCASVVTAALTISAISGCTTPQAMGDIFPMPVFGILLPAPNAYGLSYETVKVPVDADKSIRGWFVPAEEARGTVLIDHGAYFSRSFDAPQIMMFHDFGLNVMIADYEGYGDSPGTPRIDTVLPDANAALRYLQTRSDPGIDRIVIYGVSMGTLPALAQAAEKPPGVVGVIVEGVVQTDTLIPFGFDLMGIPSTPGSLSRVAADLDPKQTVPQIDMPKLFIQSQEDAMTPFQGAVELFDMAPEPKQLAPVTGIHGLSIIADPTYRDQVRAFLDPLFDDASSRIAAE